MHKNDRSVGENHVPSSPLFQLAYNIENMKIGRMKMGTKKWWKFIAAIIHQLEYADLDHVFNGRLLPQFIADRLDPGYRKWVMSRSKNRDQTRVGTAPKHNSRITRAMDILLNAPLDKLGFATIVASFEGTEKEAIKAAEKEARRLDQFIRRRFRHAVSLMFPESDIKIAKDVDAALLPNVGWKLRFDPKQRIFKIHFHGLIYVPGYCPSDIEKAFKRTANGKRSRLYSGAHQVRVIPVDQAPGMNDGTPDVDGVAGYATKYHYNPPVKTRMLEGFASWLTVTDAILKNPKTIVVTGVRAGIRSDEAGATSHDDKPLSCHEHNAQRDADAGVGNSEISELIVTPASKVVQVDIPDSLPPRVFSNVDYMLNSVSPSPWQHDQKRLQKKILEDARQRDAPCIQDRLHPACARGP
jgi:hypothetical protein